MPDYDYEARPKGSGRTRMPPLAPCLVADMKRYLGGRRLDYGVAVFNGWYPSNRAGDDLPRIVIPGTMTVRGPFWQARTMGTSGDTRGGDEPRYQSPGGERNGAVIVVRPYASPDTAVIVEGPMDALVAAMAGKLGIAVMGNNPGEATLITLGELVVDARIHRILFVPDLDSPGSCVRALGVLAAGGFACEMRIPPAKDLAACTTDQRANVLLGR